MSEFVPLHVSGIEAGRDQPVPLGFAGLEATAEASEETVPLGFGGLTAPVGAHLCAFVRGRAGRDELLLPYLEAGVRNGEKCVAIVDSSTPEQVWSSLRLPDAEKARKTGQVEVLAAEASYVDTGRFSYERMIEFWTNHASCNNHAPGNGNGNGNGGFARMRGVGELHWAVQDCLPGTESFFYYESQVNKVAACYPNILLLCIYDLDSLSGSAVIDALKTHPQVIVNGRVFHNPYHIDADVLAQEWAAEGAHAAKEWAVGGSS